MKKLICLGLALAMMFALFAACQKDLTIGQEAPTTQLVDENDFLNAINRLGGPGDDDFEAALKRAMEQGVTVPDFTEPPITMPPPMPSGVPIRAEDVYPLMENARRILDSGTYTLKARGSTAPTPGMPLGSTAITFAVDKGQSAFEANMDWTNMMRAMSEPGSREYNMAAISGATMTTLVGKKVRFVTKPEGSMIVFLEKKSYVLIPAGEGEELGDSPLNAGSMFGEMFRPAQDGTVAASKVTSNGREYLCAEIKGNEGVLLYYYFLDSQLKRIEMKVTNPETGTIDTMVFEIELLSPTVDAAMFNTAGLKAMALDELAQAGEGGFAGLFG